MKHQLFQSNLPRLTPIAVVPSLADTSRSIPHRGALRIGGAGVGDAVGGAVGGGASAGLRTVVADPAGAGLEEGVFEGDGVGKRIFHDPEQCDL